MHGVAVTGRAATVLAERFGIGPVAGRAAASTTAGSPREQWEPAFQAQGASAAAAKLRAEMLDGFNNGHVDFGVESEHVRGAVSLDEAVAKLNAV